MPEPMTRRGKAPSAAGRSETLHPLQIRYYKCMRRGYTYPVQVSWKRSERGVAARPVKLRLEVAGAIVVPSEQLLRPADPEDSAQFFVTPLSSGKLPHYELEVRYENAKIYEMPLKARASTQYFTLFLLAMTFVIPWLLNNYCYTPYKQGKLSPSESLVSLLTEYVPDFTEISEKLPDWLKIQEWMTQGVQYTGDGYEKLCDWCKEYPVSRYTAASLLVLTLLSALWNRPKRKWRTSAPIELNAPSTT